MVTTVGHASRAGTGRRLPAVLERALAVLPRGKLLPPEIFRARHRGVVALLWAHVAVLPLVGLLRGQSLVDSLPGVAVPAVLAAAAGMRRLSPNLRAALATLGLMVCSALLVHMFHGLVEVHFHFFVVVVVISLYQSWRPFLLAVGFVLVHHAVGGAIPATMVFDHPPAHSLVWALVHGGFILAESIACLVCWRASEDTLESEREAREELHSAHEALAAAQALAGVGSWNWDLGTGVVSWSDQLYAIVGRERGNYTPAQGSFVAMAHRDDRERVERTVAFAAEHQESMSFEFRLMLPDGQEKVLHALGEAVVEGATLVKMSGTCQDITERKLLQQEVEHLAFHDLLTGLANRALFLSRLEHALAVQQRSGRVCAVLFLDLDGFKAVNDGFGHSAGDALLVEVARRLLVAVRSNDTVARFGGDEFAVLLEGVDLPVATATAERIQAMLGTPVDLGVAQVTTHASIGISLTGQTTRPDDVLRRADAAMYTAKRRGRGRYSVFQEVAVPF